VAGLVVVALGGIVGMAMRAAGMGKPNPPIPQVKPQG
jgi:hypothetical protein